MFKPLYDRLIALSRKPQRALCAGRRRFRGELVVSDPARHAARADVARRAEEGLALRADRTIASVLGGMLGYAIGALLFDTIGQWLIHSTATQTGWPR